MARPSRRRGPFRRAALSFLLLGPLVVTVPATAQTPSDEPVRYDGVDVSEMPVRGQPIEPDPITDAERIPVPAPVDMNGLVDPERTMLDPGDEERLEDLIGDEIPVLEAGGPDFDAFAPEPDVGSHFLVVYPETVNERSADGKWVDLPDEIVASDQGWEISGESLSVSFPRELAPGSPIVTAAGENTLSIVPTGAVPTAGALVDGILTYAGVLPSTVAVYTALPGGYEEAIILLSPAASGTVSWDVTASGFTLKTGEEGRISVLAGDTPALEMPAPRVVDASGAETPASFALEDLGLGSYRITLEIDPSFLERAVVRPPFNRSTSSVSPGPHERLNGGVRPPFNRSTSSVSPCRHERLNGGDRCPARSSLWSRSWPSCERPSGSRDRA